MTTAMQRSGQGGYPKALIERARVRYDGGRGGSLRAIAAEFGVPVSTMHSWSSTYQWCERTAPTDAILATCRREFAGGHGLSVTELIARHGITRSRVDWHRRRDGWDHDALVLEGAHGYLHGIKRRCHGCYAITFSDPCHVCGDGLEAAS